MAKGNKPYTRKFHVKTPICSDGENADYWARCGTAYENKKSKQIHIHLDLVPVDVNKNGKVVLVLFEDEEKE